MSDPGPATGAPRVGERMTATFASGLARGLVPEFRGGFRWTRDGLWVQDEESRTLGLVRRPRDWRLPPSAGLADDGLSAVGPTAALGVLLAALGLPGIVRQAQKRAPLVASVEPFLARPDHRPKGAGSRGVQEDWLGFLPVSQGWIGLAYVGKDQRRLVRSLYHRGVLQRRSPLAAVQCLQSMGIAALPAQAVNYSGGACSPERPVPVGASGMGAISRAIRTVGDGRSDVLSGLHVIEMGRLIAAPLAGRILGGVGAVVKKVRPPGHGQSWGGGEELDVHRPDDARRIASLIADSDVLIENFRPRGWAQLPAVVRDHPGVRRVSVRGFPSSSPCRNWKVFGFLVEGWLGVGRAPLASNPRPRRIDSLPLWDRVAGICAAATAVASAVGDRPASDVSLIELGLHLSAARKEANRAHAL